MKYEYIFWDFNGTILDDVNLCLELLNEMLVSQGKSICSIEKYKSIFCFPIIEYYKKAGLSFENDSFESMAVDFIKEYQPRSLKCRIYPGVIEMFKYIKTKYKQVLLSASEAGNLKWQVGKLGIEEYFDDILGIDNIYAGSKVSIACAYVKKHGIDPSKCLMIGDTLHDLEVSNEVGFDCVLVANGHQSFEVLNVNNNKVIHDIMEIKNLLV